MRAQDETDFAAFVASSSVRLFRTAYVLCGDAGLAQDAVQASLTSAFLSWRRVRGADSPEAYVRRMVVDQLSGRRRRRGGSVEQPYADPPWVPGPDIDLESIRRLAHRRIRRRTAWAALALTTVVGALALQVTGVGVQEHGATGLAPSRAWPLDKVDEEAPVSPGRYAVRFSGDDLEPGPVAELDVPLGFRSVDGYYLHSPEGRRSLGLWIVRSVNMNPCYSVDFADPGPSVRALADALAAQPLLRGTEPTPVGVGGFDGLSLTQSVPAGLDWHDCRTWTGSSRRYTTAPPPRPMFYFGTWRDPGVGVNWAYAPGQTHRMWILDVDGRRLVVDAAYGRRSTPEQVRELIRMVESIRFRQPE